MANPRFALFDHLEHRDEPLEALYESRLKLLEAADDSPFCCYHLAEHHATPLGGAPAPGLFLAAASQRTSRIRLGPMVYLLPLYDPVRLAEEICMLDHLSGGRLDVGVGRGVSPFELGHLGIPFMEARDRFDEALEVLITALRSERLDFKGEFHRYRDLPLVMHPTQRPNPPIWYGASSQQSVQWAAERGVNIIGGGPNAMLSPLLNLYRHLHENQAGNLDQALNAPQAEPTLGVFRQVFVAETDAEAEAIARRSYDIFYHNIMQLWMASNTISTQIAPEFEAADHFEVLITGSPETVAGKIEGCLQSTGTNYVALEVAWGDLSHNESMHSFELLRNEVVPRFANFEVTSPKGQ